MEVFLFDFIDNLSYICNIIRLFMGYIDRKITIWERHYFDDKEFLNEEIVNEVVFNCEDNELLYETSEPIKFEENNNKPTIEVYDDKGNMIWSNEPIHLKRENKINNLI